VGALNDDETYACHIAHQEALEVKLRRERELSEKLDGLNAGQILELYEKELGQQAKRSTPQQGRGCSSIHIKTAWTFSRASGQS